MLTGDSCFLHLSFSLLHLQIFFKQILPKMQRFIFREGQMYFLIVFKAEPIYIYHHGLAKHAKLRSW